MKDVTYSTKLWQGDLDALARHPKADLVITNNTHAKIVDMGKTDAPYFAPEMEAVKRCKTKYFLWYSADVIPPETDWVTEALFLLETYPIVTCRWDGLAPEQQAYVDITDFGWTTFHFSDQCFVTKTDYIKNIDYETKHPIAEDYPKHGGNSFERRVAQYLANQGTPSAVLGNHQYKHILKDEKDTHYEY